MISFRSAAVFLLTFCLFGLDSPAQADLLIVPGTGDSQVLLRQIVTLYNQKSSTTIVIPDSIGSSGGIRQVQRDQASLARVARHLNEKEIESGLRWKQFAYAPVVFACNSEVNGVDNLSSEQVTAIFTGKHQDWSRVGGEAGKIYLAQREAGDSSRSVLSGHFPIFAESGQMPGKTLYSTPEMVAALSRHQGTVGYLPLSAIKGTGIRPLALDGVAPTEKTLQDGSYPLSVPLAVVWSGKLDPETSAFVDFLFSSTARAVIQQFGAVPVAGE